MTVNYDTYRVTWSQEDEEFVGLCPEFPSLSWLVSDQDEAFSGIRSLVADSVEDMLGNDEQPPKPIADRSYSGKFIVRVPPEMHRALAMRSAEEGVSLNRLVNAGSQTMLGSRTDSRFAWNHARPDRALSSLKPLSDTAPLS